MSPPSSVVKPERGKSVALDNVVRLPVRGTGSGFAPAARGPHRRVSDLLVDNYAADIERILFRILGPDDEIADLLHDVLIVAMTSIESLRDDAKLRSWITGIAVHKARKLIRHRKVRRLIKLVAPFELPECEAATPTTEVSDALRETYRVLAELPTDDRIAFALRHVDGMALLDIAEATRVSMATVKRRVSRAERAFVDRARNNETLAEWLEQGTLGP